MADKILIGTPIHWIKAYSMARFVLALEALDFPKDRIKKIMVDTSEKDWAFPKSIQTEVRKINIDQTRTPNILDLVNRRLVAAFNLLRQEALDGGFSHLFSVECDVIIPQDALTKLLAADKPIIEGLFYTRPSHYHPQEWWTAGDVIKECSPRGTLGVCLIKREVLEKISFKYYPKILDAFPDANFYFDADRERFRSFVHCGVKCEHLETKKGTRGWEEL